MTVPVSVTGSCPRQDVGRVDPPPCGVIDGLAVSLFAVTTLSVMVSCGGPPKKATLSTPPPRTSPATPSAVARFPTTRIRSAVSSPLRLPIPPPAAFVAPVALWAVSCCG